MSNLHIIATPIGNLEDITLRALRILKEVDWIACEDTRHSKKLLSHFGISKPLYSCHSHNERGRIPQLIQKLQSGESGAIITDAGTPGISDPGSLLIREAIRAGIGVIPIPGPAAVITALCASGLETDRFYFQGFLPLKPGKRRKQLAALKELPATLIFYESGRRLHRLFKDLTEAFGNRPAVLARELTKIYEEFKRNTLSELFEKIPDEGMKGECVVLVAGAEFGEEEVETAK